MNPSSRVVLVFWSVFVGLAAVLLAMALSTGQHPSPVADSLGERLDELARRGRVEAASTQRPLLLSWRPSSRCGRYYGTALAAGGDRPGALAGSETQLRVSLEAHRQLSLRNPGRQPLPALLLTRQELVSDLVPPGDGQELALRFDSGPIEERNASRITVNNLTAPAGPASAQAFNRGFAVLVGDAHCDLSAPQAQQLDLLAELLRARVCDERGEACRDTVLTLGPASQGGRVLAKVRAQGEEAFAAFEILLRLSPEGQPVAAAAEPLAEPTLLSGWKETGAVAWLSFHTPVPPGTPLPPPLAEVRSDPGPAPAVTVDLAAMVAATGWSKVREPWQ